MRLVDVIGAAVALLLFAGFLGIIAVHVPAPPLLVVFGVCIAMAAFDFYREMRSQR
jgi:hypothetical protein